MKAQEKQQLEVNLSARKSEVLIAEQEIEVLTAKNDFLHKKLTFQAAITESQISKNCQRIKILQEMIQELEGVRGKTEVVN